MVSIKRVILENNTMPQICRIFLLSLFVFAGSLRAQVTVGGSASSLGGDCYRLTNTINNQAGYVYFNTPLNLNQPFDYQFSVYLGTNNGGADGIVFVVRDTLAAPFIGNSGGAIGYSGSGFTESFGIEVDTWQNNQFGDIGADHIGIISEASVSHILPTSLAGPIQADPNNANVEDGSWHYFNVKWEPSIPKLSIYFDCDERLSYTGNVIDSIFNGDPNVYWGFIGTTGGANNDQRFCFTIPLDSMVTSLNDTTICAGDSVQLDAGNTTPSYVWNNTSSLSSSTISNPIAFPSTTTTYNVTATHACDTIVDTVTVNIQQPNFTIDDSITSPLCFNDCNGAIDLTIQGNSTYGFTWSTGQSTEDISGLCDGNYSVTVVDSSGCYDDASFTVTHPDLLNVSILNPTKTSCPGGTTCDAWAETSVTGGTAPYYYLWSTGEFTDTAGQLCADTNYVTVTDDNGCTADNFIDIQIPDSIVTVATGATQICISQQTPVLAASIGGTPPFTYKWYRGSLTGNQVANTASYDATPTKTTTYFVKSTDANGCEGDTSQVTIKVRPKLDVEITEFDTICPYDTILLEATGFGGDTNYTFAWGVGVIGPSIEVSPDLSRSYKVTVTDGCGTPAAIDSVYIQVGGYSPIEAKLRADDDSLCLGEQTFVVARGTGGYRGPEEYRYRWSQSSDTGNIFFTKPKVTKTYTVTISDLCLSEPGIDTLTIYVKEPEELVTTVSPATLCTGSEVIIHLKDWNQKYEYNWLIGQNYVYSNHKSDTVNRVFSDSGCYDLRIEVTDDFGCKASKKENCALRVFEQPLSIIEKSRPYVTNTDPTVELRDASEHADKSIWYFRNDTIENTPLIDHTVEAERGERVYLLVETKDGCVDTSSVYIELRGELVIYIPNSFTPNGDGLNDVFKVESEFLDPENFQMTIYNRWGEQVFRSKNPLFGWDGNDTRGNPAQLGEYMVVIQYLDKYNELQTVRQPLTLFKVD